MAQKIQTTFGVVTVFKNNKNDDTSNDKNKQPKIQQQTIPNSKIDLKNNSKAESENENENFFGLEVTTYKKEELNDFNYFDQQILSDYKTKDESIDLTNMKKEIKIDKTDLNYIDNYYFNNKNEEIPNETLNKEIKSENITKSDLESSNDLNYIDEMIFRKEDDKKIGSILSLKKEKIHSNKLKAKQNVEIPLIRTNEFADDEEHNQVKFKSILKSTDSEKKIKESKHKELDNEVPKWYNLTIDEAANILKSHVCYINEERKYSFN